MVDETNKNNEKSLQEYVLIMREMTNIEMYSVIQLVMDGIPTHLNQKIVLHGTKDLKNVKQKLKISDTRKVNDKNTSKDKFIDTSKQLLKC